MSTGPDQRPSVTGDAERETSSQKREELPASTGPEKEGHATPESKGQAFIQGYLALIRQNPSKGTLCYILSDCVPFLKGQERWESGSFCSATLAQQGTLQSRHVG